MRAPDEVGERVQHPTERRHLPAQHVPSPRRAVLQRQDMAQGGVLGEHPAHRSEVYGGFPPVRVDDRGARALGFAPRGVDEGLALTAEWLRAEGALG